MGEAKSKMTEAEYLALTASGELAERVEWINGAAYAMAGGTARHAAVATNIAIALGIAMRGGPCRPTNGDQRIAIADTGAYLYPDAVVVCGPYAMADDGLSVVNPSVVFEVLSPSTRTTDVGPKFEHYRRIETLTDYVVVDPDAGTVTHHARHPDGWLRRDYDSGVLSLMEGATALPLAEIFADLDNVPSD